MRKLFILALHIALLSILVPPVVVQAETRDAALRQTPATVDELVALLGEHVPSGEDARIFAQQNEEARERRNTEAQTRGLAGLLAPNSSLEQMLLSRRSVGLSDDPALVLGLTADPALRAPGDVQAYGLMLTPAELQELDTRLRAQDHMYLVYEYIKDRMPPEHFGGIWIEGGSTFIGVTAERDLYEDDLRATFPLPDRLQVVLQRQPGVILQRVRLSIRPRDAR